ncbi:metal-dependent hydrolase [Halorussus salilacus]|uniref:metal-dependent hydrolase n=1 Tax=Halorussus salilacus TaxID=2953750 RepID=UPI00209D4595|nr:metal-dependent hydrolase [Halorussus salilacus]USZ67495.1 metal-dependent hydrolase [Halorussus salilacus]
MFRPGHYGVSLALYAPVGGWLLATGQTTAALAGGALALWLSMLPDLDTRLPFVPHRGPTHTLPFVALVAVAAWAAATATGHGVRPVGPVEIRAFAAGIAALAVLSHLAADVLTPMGVALLWPVSGRRYTLSVCRADNRVANALLFALGVFATASAAYLGTMLFANGGA